MTVSNPQTRCALLPAHLCPTFPPTASGRAQEEGGEGDFGTGEKKAGEANGAFSACRSLKAPCTECDAAGYGTVAVDLAAEAKKLKEAAANAKPGDPLYVHQPGQNVPPPVA